MNHREEPDEPGPKAPPPKVIRQSNSTPVEGSRPRWRPCQLNSPDEQGSGHHHHHHHHHYHRQSHQQQSGSNRAPPRRSRRNVPSHAQRRSSESGDAEPQPDQQPRTGGSRYRQVGVGGLQHRHRQQHKQIPAVLQPLNVPEINPDLATLSPEESSQELLTSSSQEDLTPQEVPTPSSQEVPHVEEQEGGSPGLHCSSSTESSLHTHSEEPEDQHREREQTEECMGEIDKWEVEGFQENREAEQEEQVEKNPVEKESMANTGNSKDSKKTSRRFGPIRVDVPPFSEFPRQPLPIPKFQTQPFKGFPLESKSGPNHLTSTNYTAMSTDMRPESPSDTQSYEETLSNSTTEACSTSYPSVSESCPKFYLVTPTESGREPFHSNSQTGRYQEQSEEQQSFGKNSDMSPSEAQINLHEEQRPRVSVGSRLHHYDEQSGDEAGSPDRSRSKVWRCSEEQECSEIRKEQCEVRPSLSVLYKEEKPQQDCVEDRPQSMQESANLSGDAISLAIRDIKEAIEDVKTKMVRSPYTPDKPKEPVWVMRRDISPVEECGPQLPSPPSPPQLPSPPSPPQPPSPQNTSCSQVLASDPTVPQGAESSRAHDHQEADISPSLPTAEELRRNLAAFPTYVDVPGPCDPDDLIDGIIFAASFLGSTQLLSERTPSKSARMQQAQEAMTRVRGAGGELLSTTEVDLFVSTQRIKVLNADTQETMMDHPLRTISYIADIGNMVVLMARRKMIRSRSVQDSADAQDPAQDEQQQYRMICHVFESEDAQLIAQSIGQSFSVAYQEFLRANGIDPEDLSQREYSDLLNTQDMYNDDLVHFSKSENCRDVYIEKQKGEILGVVIVESGWGSILPTVIIASLMHAGPAAKSGRLNIGDQIMTVNGTSLVGLPLSTCQSIIKGLKSQSRIKMNIVRCPPVTMVLIRRPDLRYQLGFSVQNGIICSLMRGGIAERGGVRVGHRIIEINGQSVVATPHEKIVHILSSAVGEIHMKTMPAAMYRLLTAQEQPVYI
ncbi:amyloid-beta A4 precursor protein-binding family A member 1 isoform X1 [Tachysurus fulvidraco]|uniref:amyloid-beta A4 precursor protein-binding family A member 1 isoform X1 n=1 Tax=Tachysurus fulvidraco TaxID=1234273 RepID=UPI001FEE2DB2|nr:amyloid-beta A4 precursor protein-binding family A member 1 isoform X1 [Tachysurus fulvidraco]XP_047660856.1 amyloid-beta A4 precursor protein-binding family A member 1 isoform X1 [Tachysurus fulvidraco]